MITSNRRIFLAVFLSLVIFFGIKYIYANPNIFRPENILASIRQIKLPDFSSMFKLNLKPTNQIINNNSFLLPTTNLTISNQFKPTLAPSQAPRTTASVVRPTKKPTSRPQPTAIHSPPPITSDVRPGNTLGEIFEEVSKRICVPAALLRAFQEEETGPWIPYNTPSSTIKNYNSYGWWKTGPGDPCLAFAYDLKTGVVPSDSVKAGTKCPIYISSANSGIMGLFALDQYEQEGARKYTLEILPNNLDRRVMFDNALIFAIITKNRVVEPENCDSDWPDDVVRLAAQKHLGACIAPENGRSYCDEVLSLYKKYR